MAYTPDRLYAGTLGTTLTTTLATAGAGEKLLVKQALFCNTTGADVSVTLYIAGVRVAAGLTVPAASTIEIPLTQVVRTTETIAGGASATGVDCSIGGVRIT
jgi:hypothetical protein